MRKLAMFGVMAAVLGLGLSAWAADNNTPELYAVSQLSAGANLQTMTDSQLTSVEGMSWRGHTKDCGCGRSYWSSVKQSNDLYQTNVNMYTKLFGEHTGINQQNFAHQSNNVGGGVPAIR